MELKLDARMRRLVRRVPVVNVYSLAELLLLALLAIQVARLVWTVVTPVDPLGRWRPEEPVVPARSGELLSSFDPFFRVSAPAAGPAVVTALQLQLFGIRLDDATGRGAAIIAGPDGVQRSIAVGEEIQPGVSLKAVAFDHVTVDRGGADEDLFLDQSGGTGASTSPATTPAAPAAATPAITADQLRGEIGFIPRLDDGRISGLAVRAQGTGTLFRQAGLRDGDVVTQIAGRSVSSLSDVERIASDFAGGGTIPITVERGGQSLPLSIAVAPR